MEFEKNRHYSKIYVSVKKSSSRFRLIQPCEQQQSKKQRLKKGKKYTRKYISSHLKGNLL